MRAPNEPTIPQTKNKLIYLLQEPSDVDSKEKSDLKIYFFLTLLVN